MAKMGSRRGRGRQARSTGAAQPDDVERVVAAHADAEFDRSAVNAETAAKSAARRAAPPTPPGLSAAHLPPRAARPAASIRGPNTRPPSPIRSPRTQEHG